MSGHLDDHHGDGTMRSAAACIAAATWLADGNYETPCGYRVGPPMQGCGCKPAVTPRGTPPLHPEVPGGAKPNRTVLAGSARPVGRPPQTNKGAATPAGLGGGELRDLAYTPLHRCHAPVAACDAQQAAHTRHSGSAPGARPIPTLFAAAVAARWCVWRLVLGVREAAPRARLHSRPAARVVMYLEAAPDTTVPRS